MEQLLSRTTIIWNRLHSVIVTIPTEIVENRRASKLNKTRLASRSWWTKSDASDPTIFFSPQTTTLVLLEFHPRRPTLLRSSNSSRRPPHLLQGSRYRRHNHRHSSLLVSGTQLSSPTPTVWLQRWWKTFSLRRYNHLKVSSRISTIEYKLKATTLKAFSLNTSSPAHKCRVASKTCTQGSQSSIRYEIWRIEWSG